MSRRSAELVPRTETADSLSRSVCPYCAVGCGQRVYRPYDRVGGPRPRHGDGHDRRPGDRGPGRAVGRRRRGRAAAEPCPRLFRSGRRDRPILDLAWDYPTHGRYDEPSSEAVLREIGGYEVLSGRSLRTFGELREDGSTVCGAWIYCGVYADGVNQAARRRSQHEQTWVAPEWGWAWPDNRRLLYNRASADPEGRPWSARKKYLWWDADQGIWTGYDTPDFQKTKPPSYRPGPDARGTEAIAGDDPFIMQGDGKGWLYVPSGLLDGPMPTHYEPPESPTRNPLYGQQANPVRKVYDRPENITQPSPPEPHTDVYPYVFTIARLTEHHTAGGMSRYVEHLAELQPQMFFEVSPELAAERGLTHLD